MKIFSKVVGLISLTAIVVGLSGCGGAKLSPKMEEAFSDNKTMYTTSNMHYTVSRRTKIINATNNTLGILIPINSEVTMEDINSKQLVFNYNDSDVILRNRVKYSGLDIGQIAERAFSFKKTDLSKFTKLELKGIRTAQALPGMSKDAVVAALGVPLAHQTPTLEMDEWKYWKSSWSTFIVYFKNGKVIPAPARAAKTSTTIFPGITINSN
jgi:hypothetical protein